MHLDFAIKLKIGYERTAGGVAMADWSDDAIRKLNQKREDKRLDTARFVEEQRIKSANGLPLWTELKDRIRAHISELKQKSNGADIIAIQDERPNDLVLRSVVDDGATLHVAFDPGRGKVTWDCRQEPQRGWEVTVTETGDARFQWGMIPTTPDSMATQMLEKLLEI